MNMAQLRGRALRSQPPLPRPLPIERLLGNFISLDVLDAVTNSRVPIWNPVVDPAMYAVGRALAWREET